jgi:hypothetical protein
MIPDVHPGSGYFPSRISDPEVKKAPYPGYRIWIRNTDLVQNKNKQGGFFIHCFRDLFYSPDAQNDTVFFRI